MTKNELIELFDEAIGNAKCIGRLDGMWQGRGPWPEQDYRGMVALEQANSSKRKKLSDALELADKRIAELEGANHGLYEGTMRQATRIAELEHKLSVAREALIQLANAADNQGAFTGMSWQQAKAITTAALAQIAATEQK